MINMRDMRMAQKAFCGLKGHENPAQGEIKLLGGGANDSRAQAIGSERRTLLDARHPAPEFNRIGNRCRGGGDHQQAW
jgi:hypothetical protein